MPFQAPTADQLFVLRDVLEIENYANLDRFSEAHPEFVRESVAPELPPVAQSLVNARGEFCSAVNAFNMDGFFAARFRRSA